MGGVVGFPQKHQGWQLLSFAGCWGLLFLCGNFVCRLISCVYECLFDCLIDSVLGGSLIFFIHAIRCIHVIRCMLNVASAWVIRCFCFLFFLNICLGGWLVLFWAGRSFLFISPFTLHILPFLDLFTFYIRNEYLKLSKQTVPCCF